MNQQLSALYESVYADIRKDLSSFEGVSQPLLCRVPDDYQVTAIRLMVLGQQTNFWEPELGADPVSGLMQHYQTFVLKGGTARLSGKPRVILIAGSILAGQKEHLCGPIS
jgi:hypothetical protein